MINVFRKNDLANIILLLPYTIVLRIHSILHPVAYTAKDVDSILIKWFFDTVSAPLTQSIIAIVLIFGQAILINSLGNGHRLYRTPNALAGMFYILLVSSIPDLQILSPALIGITFILIAVFYIFKTYKMTVAATSIFNAALASAIAAIIYPPYFIAIVAIFMGLTMMRNFKLIERIQFMVGYGVLLWIFGVLLFYYDLLSAQTFSFLSFPGAMIEITWLDQKTLWTLGSVLFLVFLSLVNYYNFVKKKGIDVRKKISFFYWLLACSLIALIFFQGLSYQHFFFVATSFAVFLAMTTLLIRNRLLSELLHLFLLVGVFYLQFGL